MADGVTIPMRVDTSLLQGIAAANQAAQAKSSSLKSTGTTTSFSSALKSASSEKETTKPVDGQQYAEILTGPRAGMYLNTGGGARDGEAFILVKHDGREDHIYGTGKDRKVDHRRRWRLVLLERFELDSDDDLDRLELFLLFARPSKAPADETTKQVTGRAYADILTGSRSGLYLNTSGNVRDGQTFALVKREGREFHVYGTGKDRQIIGLRKPADAAADTGSTSTTGTTTADTTGNDVVTTSDTPATTLNRLTSRAGGISAGLPRTRSATSRADAGPSVIPHAPWPLAT